MNDIPSKSGPKYRKSGIASKPRKFLAYSVALRRFQDYIFPDTVPLKYLTINMTDCSVVPLLVPKTYKLQSYRPVSEAKKCPGHCYQCLNINLAHHRIDDLSKMV